MSRMVLTKFKASSINKYLSSISEIFMIAGRKCPLNADFGAIYSESKRLQVALCEYNILVVELCTEVVRFLKKPPIEQSALVMIKLYNDSIFAESQKKLEDQMQVIRDEVLCASSLLQRDSAIQISLGSKMLSKVSDEHAQQLIYRQDIHRRKARLRFLDSFSTYNYQLAFRQARTRGTVTWFLSNNAYNVWRQQNHSSLWCSGILGSGKSVLTANVIKSLLYHHGEASVVFFFCRHEDGESLRSETIIRCISRQIIQNLKLDFEDMHFRHDISEEDQLFTCMQNIADSSKEYFVVIDGLDECDDTETRSLLKFLSRLLRSSHNFRIYCASRPELLSWTSGQIQVDHVIDMGDDTTAISDYITSTLIESLETGRLSLGNEAIIIDITESLLSKAEGMFLWVALQIDSICAQKSDEAILHTLDGLPRGLPATFAHILHKTASSEHGDPSLAKRIFMTIDEARKPLRKEELREAISVQPGDVIWKPEKMINDMDKAIRCCSSLVLIDEEEETVHFTHSSVRQYFHREGAATVGSKYGYTSQGSQLLMARVVLTYLNYNGKFETQIAKFNEPQSENTDKTSQSLVDHLIPDSKFASNVGRAVLYLKSKGGDKRDLRQQLINKPRQYLSADSKNFHEHEHAFLSYAQQFWFSHSRAIALDPNFPGGDGRLLDRLVSGNVKLITLPWAPEKYEEMTSKVLQSVALNRHWGLIRIILEDVAKSRYFVDADLFCTWIDSLPEQDYPFNVKRFYTEMLHTSCSVNQIELPLVEKLIEKGANVNILRDNSTPLELSALHGNVTHVSKLLIYGADPYLQGPKFQGALKTAKERNHEKIVQLLSDRESEITRRGEAIMPIETSNRSNGYPVLPIAK